MAHIFYRHHLSCNSLVVDIQVISIPHILGIRWITTRYQKHSKITVKLNEQKKNPTQFVNCSKHQEMMFNAKCSVLIYFYQWRNVTSVKQTSRNLICLEIRVGFKNQNQIFKGTVIFWLPILLWKIAGKYQIVIKLYRICLFENPHLSHLHGILKLISFSVCQNLSMKE